MPSPFPGMNPYLEQPGVWHDFHQAFIIAIRAAITPQIRPAYLATVDDHVYIHELSADARVLVGRPDFSISTRSGSGGATATEPGVVAPAYGQIPPAVDQVHESFIEIRDRETREIITVIELLSPTNKTPGSDREQYLGKRSVLLASNTHEQYDAAGYEDYVYLSPPVPPLDSQVKAWADQLLPDAPGA